MAYACDICGKGKQFGHNVSFSQRKTQKVWKPNLQTKRLQVGTNKTTFKLCTQCLRTMKQQQARDAAKAEVATAEA